MMGHHSTNRFLSFQQSSAVLATVRDLQSSSPCSSFLCSFQPRPPSCQIWDRRWHSRICVSNLQSPVKSPFHEPFVKERHSCSPLDLSLPSVPHAPDVGHPPHVATHRSSICACSTLADKIQEAGLFFGIGSVGVFVLDALIQLMSMTSALATFVLKLDAPFARVCVQSLFCCSLCDSQMKPSLSGRIWLIPGPSDLRSTLSLDETWRTSASTPRLCL